MPGYVHPILLLHAVSACRAVSLLIMHATDQVTRNMFTLVPTVNKPLFDAVQAARLAAVGDAKIGGWYGIVAGQPFAEFCHIAAAAQGVCTRLRCAWVQTILQVWLGRQRLHRYRVPRTGQSAAAVHWLSAVVVEYWRLSFDVCAM